MFDAFQSFAAQAPVDVPQEKTAVDVQAAVAGFDIDSYDWEVFKRYWRIREETITIDDLEVDVYTGWHTLVAPYTVWRAALPGWSIKCPVAILRS